MRLKATTLALLPVLLVQGYKVKKNTLRLPEPEGERQGILGQGKSLSILIIGDSAAAGVGVKHQDDALSGSILAELRHQFQTTWKLVAKTGHTSLQIVESIKNIESQHFDVVVTSVGVNDVTKLMSANQWIKKQEIIYTLIQNKFSPQLVIASGVPPMHMFPILPHPLGWLFGQYAYAMNDQLKKYISLNPQMDWIEYDIQQYRDLKLNMAEDGFHPSKEVYQLWAKQVAEKIRNKFINNGTI